MTASVLQENSNESNPSVNSVATTLTGVTAGSTIAVLVTCDDSAGTSSATVSDGTSYTAGNTSHNAAFQQYTASFYLQNVSSGSKTITATLNTFHPAAGIWAIEVGGVASASFDGKNTNTQGTPGTGADGVTVTSTPNSTLQPALIVAWGFSVSNNPAPAAGTGFTSTKTAWNFTAGAQCRSENKRVTATGAQTATFTAGLNASHDSFIFVFDETGATAGTTGWGFDGPPRVVRAYSIPKALADVVLPPLAAAPANTPSGFDSPTRPTSPVRAPRVVAPEPIPPIFVVQAGGYDSQTPRPPAAAPPRQATADAIPPIFVPGAAGYDSAPNRSAQPKGTAPQQAAVFPPLTAAALTPYGFDSAVVRPRPPIAPKATLDAPLPAPKLLWPLSIHSSGRYLVDASGAPFFQYGMSAWSVFTEPSDYRPLVDDAAALGINMLMCRFIDKTTHNAPNLRDGTAPFNTPGDFTTLNSAYAIRFRDFIRYCAARGIFVWFTPAYDGFAGASTDGWRPEKVSNGTTGCNTLGSSIGSFLSAELNVGVVAGGDFTPPGTDHLDQNTIAGLQSTAPQITLVMAHPDQSTRSPQWTVSDDYPNVTSTVRGCYSWFGDTGGNNRTIYTVGRSQYNASPTRPVIYLEAEYRENTINGQLGTDFTTRFQAIAFWLETVNGFGPGVGAEGFWPALLITEPHGTIPPQAQGKDWPTSIGLSCFAQLQSVQAFATSRQWWKLVPDQGSTLVTAGRGTYGTDSYRNAALASDGSFGLVYLPTGTTGGTVTVNMARFYGPTLARWWSPTSNSYTAINGGVPFQATGSQTFTAPDTNDWILALDATPLQPFIELPTAPRPSAAKRPAASLAEPLPALAGTAALTAFGFDGAVFRPRTQSPQKPSSGDALPPIFVGTAAGYDAPTIRPVALPILARTTVDAIPPIFVAGAAGYETSAARSRTPAIGFRPSFDIIPGLVTGAWGFDQPTPPVRVSPSPPRSPEQGWLPPLQVIVLTPWGFDWTVVRPRTFRPGPPQFDVWPAVIVPPPIGPWGWDTVVVRPAPIPPPRIVFPDSLPGPVVQAFTAWGWDSPAARVARAMAIARAELGAPLPGLAVQPWAPDAGLVRLAQPSFARSVVPDPIPPLIALPPWGFDWPTAPVRPWAISRISSPAEPFPAALPPPPIGPFGWDFYPPAPQLSYFHPPRIRPFWFDFDPMGLPLLLFSAVAPRERTLVALPSSRVFKVRAK